MNTSLVMESIDRVLISHKPDPSVNRDSHNLWIIYQLLEGKDATYMHYTLDSHVSASVHMNADFVHLKKNIRIICGGHPWTHKDLLHENLHILNVNGIRDNSIALFFMFKLHIVFYD